MWVEDVLRGCEAVLHPHLGKQVGYRNAEGQAGLSYETRI